MTTITQRSIIVEGPAPAEETQGREAEQPIRCQDQATEAGRMITVDELRQIRLAIRN